MNLSVCYISLNKHDHVRIKKFISDGNKKSFRPFSEAVWEILSVNPHTNTCVLREQAEDGFQPRTRRIHKRFLRKIQKKQSDGGDDFQPQPLQEMDLEAESMAPEKKNCSKQDTTKKRSKTEKNST